MRTKILQILISAIMSVGLLFPVVASAQQVSMPSFNSPLFERTWKTDDLAVLKGEVARSWTWGNAFPSAAHVTTEPYKEAPGGMRTVQYFDKSRMEDASWRVDSNDKWAVTNGLLVVELVTGRMQLGDNTFVKCTPADIPVAGDLDQRGENVLYYSTFYNDIAPGEFDWAPEFQEFMSRDNATYKVGLASSPAWWTTAKVGGTMKDVLVQLGERRALTFTPSNPDGWKVEWGNVGLHYYNWRYGASGCEGKQDTGQQPASPSPAPTVPDATAVTHVDLGICASVFPTENMESMARSLFDNVEPGKVVDDGERQSAGFHPIYNKGLYEDTGGIHGQYSWFFSYCVAQEQGGELLQWNGADGQFVFRHNEVNASNVLVIRTTEEFKDQFMNGATGRAAINVKTNPFEQVLFVKQDGTVFCPNEYLGKGDCRASKDGDMLVQVPDNGVIALYVASNSPPKTLEVRYHQGPDDRWEGINRMDGANYAW